MKLSWRDFYSLGLHIATNTYTDRSASPTDHQERIFRSQFGVSWHVCEDVWKMLDFHLSDEKRDPKHLLWALLFMKVYGSESTHSNMVGTSSKTFQKWVWKTLTEIADLKAMTVSEKSKNI